MTNINAFYPQRLKGWALALNAGGGNLGVPTVQLVGLLVIATVGNRQPYWVCAVYLVLLAVAAIGAALYMDNLQDYQIQLSTMRAVLSERHTWVIALFYIGTFGSFIGFSFAFGQVLQINFIASGQTTAQASLHAAQIAFVGTLLGSVSRVYGGRLADRIGGGRVTLGVFCSMIPAAGILINASTFGGRLPARAGTSGNDDRLCGRLHRTVHFVRHRQWLCVQNDSDDLRGAQPLVASQRNRAPAVVALHGRRSDRRARRRRRVAVASYLLADGLFQERLRSCGADVVSPALGTHPGLARLVASRFHEALSLPREAMPAGRARC